MCGPPPRARGWPAYVVAYVPIVRAGAGARGQTSMSGLADMTYVSMYNIIPLVRCITCTHAPETRAHYYRSIIHGKNGLSSTGEECEKRCGSLL